MRGKSLIVGGGIGAGSPFTLNAVTFVSSVDPATIATTDFLSVVPTGVNRGLIVGTADPALGPERLRVKGGSIIESASHVDTTCIGDGTDSGATGQILIGNAITPGAGANHVLIGNAVAITGTATQYVAIGQAASIGANAGGGSVAIGQSSSVTNSTGVAVGSGANASGGGTSHSIAIGTSAAASGANGSVALGAGNLASGSGAVALGPNVTVAASGGIGIGGSVTTAGHTNSITIGNSANAFAAQMLNIGTNSGGSPINLVAIGHGLDTIANPTGVRIRLTNASGVDNAAGSLTVQPGLSTGNIATGGNIIFQTGTPGATGATLQAAATRFTIAQASVTFDATVQAIHEQDRGVRFNNQTNAAGAAAGTLLNAPAAGDPAFWLKISIGGVNHAIPCWLG